MRIEFVEKLILILVFLTVLGVGGGVVTLAVLFPGGLRSGVPDVAVQSDSATEMWLANLRTRSGGPGMAPVVIPDAPIAGLAVGQAPTTPAAKAAVKKAGIKKSQEYYSTNKVAPEDQALPGVDWLRKQPGVAYHRPRKVSKFVYAKYQSFNDTWTTVQSGGGKFTETKDGQTAYQVTWLDPRSELASMVGLRQNDKVIAVNGQPIGRSVDAGRSMYEQLEGQKKFAVMIERNGKRMVLPFYVP
ncbi:MAG: hypothetical protein JKY65_33035 [Planctomycetes bacterium]|nr:hypothetical protein [Planctomycetota bacterium]